VQVAETTAGLNVVFVIARLQLIRKYVDWYLMEHGKIKFNIYNFSEFCFVTCRKALRHLYKFSCTKKDGKW
jgi:hypothetical protein